MNNRNILISLIVIILCYIILAYFMKMFPFKNGSEETKHEHLQQSNDNDISSDIDINNLNGAKIDQIFYLVNNPDKLDEFLDLATKSHKEDREELKEKIRNNIMTVSQNFAKVSDKWTQTSCQRPKSFDWWPNDYGVIVESIKNT